MLRVVHSNRSAALADALVESLGARPDPFSPLRVVVAGRLVERWLMRQLAERRGIAAGVRWQSFEAMLISAYAGDDLGRAHRVAAIDRATLPLALASVLSACAGGGRRGGPSGTGALEAVLDPLLDPVLGPVRAYLASDDPLDVARRVQLADRLADLYWSYGLSRPQWLLAWERRERLAELAGDPAAVWQAEIWARLIEHVAAAEARRWRQGHPRRS
jgi:exodeoxyribonuclease V gamma subunit